MITNPTRLQVGVQLSVLAERLNDSASVILIVDAVAVGVNERVMVVAVASVAGLNVDVSEVIVEVIVLVIDLDELEEWVKLVAVCVIIVKLSLGLKEGGFLMFVMITPKLVFDAFDNKTTVTVC